MQLGPLDMLVATTDRTVLGDVVLDSLAGRNHSSVADSLAGVLLLDTLWLGN